jgi:hypothetical protein
LSGLSESDSNSWEKVADQYVWGDARADDQKIFDWKTREWQDERKLSVKLKVWDGRGEPQAIVLTITNNTAEAAARELVRAIETLFRRNQTKSVVEEVRNRISASIYAGYSGLPMNFWFDSPEGRRQWFDAVQLLETACFFNPGNIAAREQLLRLRWGTALAGSDAGKRASRIEQVTLDRLMLSGELESASRNKFFFARRRSEAWGKYVEQFGFKSALTKPGLPGIASEYVLSAWQPFELFGYAQENQAQWGMPRDAGLREIAQWENQFGSEFVSRLLEAPDDPALKPSSMEFFCHALSIPNLDTRARMIDKFWPRVLEEAGTSPIGLDGSYLSPLKKYFEEIGQPGGEKKLLAQLDAANQKAEAQRKASSPPSPSIKLPRIAELASESAQVTDIFSMPPMLFLPPLVEPDVQTVSFPSGIQVKGVKSMVLHDDTLWLAAEVAEPFEIKTVNGQIEKEFQPVSVDHIRLWKMDARTLKLEPVAGALATNDINGLMCRSNTLWLALNDDGIAALNVKTGELRRYEPSAGVISTNQFALADVSRGVVAIGGMTDLSILENGSETWKTFEPPLPRQNFMLGGGGRRIAGAGDELLLFNSDLLLCNLQSNTWSRCEVPISLSTAASVRSVTSDSSGGFWIVSESGLHYLNSTSRQALHQWISYRPTIKAILFPDAPASMQRRKSDLQLMQEIQQQLNLRRKLLEAHKANPASPDLFVPSSRLPGPIVGMATDGDFLWILSWYGRSCAVLAYHPASGNLVGGFSFNGKGAPQALAYGDGKLWIACDYGPNCVLQTIETAFIKSIPRGQWLPAVLSREELSTQISRLTENERAVYCFFSGDDASLISLLQSRNEADLDAQSLFLLSLAYNETGQKDQAGRLERKLNEEYPENLLTKIISSDRRLDKIRATVKARLASSVTSGNNGSSAGQDRQKSVHDLLHDFDADDNGALDNAELIVLFELEPDRIPQSGRLYPDLQPDGKASELLQMNDRNHDGQLESNELSAIMRRPSFPHTHPPFFPGHPGSNQ